MRCNIKDVVDLKSFYLKVNQICPFFTIHVSLYWFIFYANSFILLTCIGLFPCDAFCDLDMKIVMTIVTKAFSKKIGWCPFLCKSEIAILHRLTLIKVQSHGSSQILAFVFVRKDPVIGVFFGIRVMNYLLH